MERDKLTIVQRNCQDKVLNNGFKILFDPHQIQNIVNTDI
jgi:hypothetical protein